MNIHHTHLHHSIRTHERVLNASAGRTETEMVVVINKQVCMHACRHARTTHVIKRRKNVMEIRGKIDVCWYNSHSHLHVRNKKQSNTDTDTDTTGIRPHSKCVHSTRFVKEKWKLLTRNAIIALCWFLSWLFLVAHEHTSTDTIHLSDCWCCVRARARECVKFTHILPLLRTNKSADKTGWWGGEEYESDFSFKTQWKFLAFEWNSELFWLSPEIHENFLCSLYVFVYNIPILWSTIIDRPYDRPFGTYTHSCIQWSKASASNQACCLIIHYANEFKINQKISMIV